MIRTYHLERLKSSSFYKKVFEILKEEKVGKKTEDEAKNGDESKIKTSSGRSQSRNSLWLIEYFYN